jgi:hypothetical protein
VLVAAVTNNASGYQKLWTAGQHLRLLNPKEKIVKNKEEITMVQSQTFGNSTVG